MEVGSSSPGPFFSWVFWAEKEYQSCLHFQDLASDKLDKLGGFRRVNADRVPGFLSCLGQNQAELPLPVKELWIPAAGFNLGFKSSAGPGKS